MREAINEDEGGNQRRAPPVWKGPSALSEPMQEAIRANEARG
jgi:hypothetical protein